MTQLAATNVGGRPAGRTQGQLHERRAFVLELSTQGYNAHAIAEAWFKRTGIKLSPKAIREDELKAITTVRLDPEVIELRIHHRDKIVFRREALISRGASNLAALDAAFESGELDIAEYTVLADKVKTSMSRELHYLSRVWGIDEVPDIVVNNTMNVLKQEWVGAEGVSGNGDPRGSGGPRPLQEVLEAEIEAYEPA